MCYMTTRYRKMVDELADQLEPGEQVEDVALFNSIPTMCGYFAFAAVSFAAGRLFSGYHAAVLLSSVLSMWMMASAAHTLYLTQNSCVLVTDRRTFGHVGEKRFSLPHAQLKKMLLSRVLFLDGTPVPASCCAMCPTGVSCMPLLQSTAKSCKIKSLCKNNK